MTHVDRRVASWTLALALAAAACGGSGPPAPASPTAPSASPQPQPPAPGGVTVRVMTFNIQHGIDGTSRYNLQRAIDTIARLGPDIVGLQEVTRNHPSYNCDDQPALIAAGVSAQTGQRWNVSYEQEWFTPDTSCQKSGRGSGPETEGLVLLTRHPMSTTSMLPLPNSRIGLQTALQDTRGLPVIVTHLTSGTTAAGWRAQQIDRLAAWAAGFGEPRVVVGDFNAHPTDPEIQQMFGAYHDAWTDAVQIGHAVGGGGTHGTTRIDYVFFRPGATLTLQAAEVVDTAALVGVEASDHRPLVATFAIR